MNINTYTIFHIKQDVGHVIFNGVRIRSHIIDILKMLNQIQNTVFLDKKFIFMLMLELFEIEDMIEHRLDPLRRSIIQGKTDIFTIMKTY